MPETFSIPLLRLAPFLLILLVPIAVFRILDLKLTKAMLIATARMLIQLSLVGVYLGFLFRVDSLPLNLAWMLIMSMAAGASILRQSGLRIRAAGPAALPSFALTVAAVLASIAIAIRPGVLLSARYMIPLAGMLMGNILKSCIVGLERFYGRLQEQEQDVLRAFTLGATRSEAVRPYLREAVAAAVKPFLGTVATMGIVALPGMMTGQILGGTAPGGAVLYQILIIVAILTTSVLSVAVCLGATSRIAFDEHNRLRADWFRGGGARSGRGGRSA
jgi:putative ABC transport system permease protein